MKQRIGWGILGTLAFAFVTVTLMSMCLSFGWQGVLAFLGIVTVFGLFGLGMYLVEKK